MGHYFLYNPPNIKGLITREVLILSNSKYDMLSKHCLHWKKCKTFYCKQQSYQTYISFTATNADERFQKGVLWGVFGGQNSVEMPIENSCSIASNARIRNIIELSDKTTWHKALHSQKADRWKRHPSIVSQVAQFWMISHWKLINKGLCLINWMLHTMIDV